MKHQIIYQVTRQYMKQNRKRTLTTFLGIVFMVLLMTCVFVGKDTAINYLQELASQKEGKWHVSLYDITSETANKVKKLDYVKEVEYSVDYGYIMFGPSANKTRPYLGIKAYSHKDFDWMNIKLVEGKLPQDPSELVISESAIKDGAKVKIGDQISGDFFTRSFTLQGRDKSARSFLYNDFNIEPGETKEAPYNFPLIKDKQLKENRDFYGKKETYTVVGIMKTPNFETEDGAGYVALTNLDNLSGLKKMNVSLMIDSNKASSSYLTDLLNTAGNCEYDVNDYVLSFSANSSDSVVNTLVIFMSIFFIGLILIVSILLINNVFNMSFEERSRYLGMLSSVGATRKQKRSSVYYEAFILLIYALPIGIFSGFCMVKLGMEVLRPFLGNLVSESVILESVPVNLAITWKALGMVLFMCVITVILSAYLPARKVGKVGPISSIRGNVDNQKKQYVMDEKRVGRFGVEYMLAHNGLKRQKRKTKGITGAVVVLMVMIMVTTVGSSYVMKLITFRMVDNNEVNINPKRWDYVIYPREIDQEEYEELKKEIKGSKGVEKTAEWSCSTMLGTVSPNTYSEEYWNYYRNIYELYYRRELTRKEIEEMQYDRIVNVFSVDNDTYSEILREIKGKKIPKGQVTQGIVLQSGELSTDSMGISEMKPKKYQFYQLEKMTDLLVGEEMKLQIYNQKEEEMEDFPLRIAGFANAKQLEKYVEFHSQTMWIILNEDNLNSLRNKIGDGDIALDLREELYIKLRNGDTNIEKRLQSLADKDQEKYGVTKLDWEITFAKGINSIIGIMLSCFILLTSILCLLSLYNSIRGRIMGQRREYAILQSIGMTRSQIKKRLLLESIGILGKSIVISVAIATPLILMLKKGLINIFGYVILPMPWHIYGVAIVIGAVSVVTITFFCYHSEKIDNLLENIRSESI